MGVCASGRVALRGRAAEKGPYPVPGRRIDTVARPKPPIRAGGPGRGLLKVEVCSKQDESCQLYSSHTTLHRHRARRTVSARDVAYTSYIHSACRGVKRRARSKNIDSARAHS